MPLDGPADTAGRTATVETLLPAGDVGDARDPAMRRTMATSLVEQVALLQAVPAAAGSTDPPAWARWQHGPWPAPHDPIFDLTITKVWLAMARRLRP